MMAVSSPDVCDDAFTSEFDFPEHLPKLRSFDASMRCSICKELYSVPVSLKCGHCFCAECIRSHLLYATQRHHDTCCPDCRQPCIESDIRPVVDFRTTVSLYKTSIRSALLPAASSNSPELVAPELQRLSEGADHRSPDGPGLKVPAVLHMHSLTSMQLKKKLTELHLSVEGNKQQLVRRYQQFRVFVQNEKDRGGKRGIEALAKLFQKKQNGKIAQRTSKNLDSFFPAKTHADLINEIRNRQQSKKETSESCT